MAQSGHNRAAVNATKVGFPLGRNKNSIFSFALVTRQSAALSSATQDTMFSLFTVLRLTKNRVGFDLTPV